jgi:hypothetical protein
MFRALLAHLQEALHKRRLVHCVRVMSVGCTRRGVEHSSPGVIDVFIDMVNKQLYCDLIIGLEKMQAQFLSEILLQVGWDYIYIYLFNCNWVDTRWQQYSSHIHKISTQNTENGT